MSGYEWFEAGLQLTLGVLSGTAIFLGLCILIVALGAFVGAVIDRLTGKRR